jgi:hypothetical protein
LKVVAWIEALEANIRVGVVARIERFTRGGDAPPITKKKEGRAEKSR